MKKSQMGVKAKMLTEIQHLKMSAGEKKHQAPVTIEWKGVRMVRNHSFKASVKEIVNFSKTLDVVKIGIIGEPHTGKSTLSLAIAHLIHTMSEVPFAVRVFDKDGLLNFEATLRKLTPANYILAFQDVSFMGGNAEKKQTEMVKQAMTHIRHLEGGQDVKIITIMEYHYTLGLDKYLRQSYFKYFTSIGSSEVDNMEKIVGSGYNTKILEFQRIFNKAITKKKFTFRLGTKGKFFTYNYRDPFIPTLFYNNDTLRYVVTPTREFLTPICSICEMASGKSIQNAVSIDQFVEDGYKKFTEQTFKSGLKHILLLNGMTTYTAPIVRARRYIEGGLERKLMSLEDLAIKCKIKLTKTRLDENYDTAFEESKIEPKTQIMVRSEPEPEKSILNEYSQYDTWDYQTIVAELDKMAKLSPEEIDKDRYEYLNTKARMLITI